jgi:hypothetical protein
MTVENKKIYSYAFFVFNLPFFTWLVMVQLGRAGELFGVTACRLPLTVVRLFVR